MPLIRAGWMRTLLFFAAFLLIYLLTDLVYTRLYISTDLPLLYAGAMVFAVAAVITVPPFVLFVDARSVRSIGFDYTGRRRDAITGALLSLVLLAVTSVILLLNNNLRVRDGFISPGGLFAGFGIMCLVAVAEEMVFRGYILGNLMLSFNKGLALFISAMLFSFLHTSNPGISAVAVLNVFLAGLLLGLNYIYTRNLWFSICFHLLWNFVQGPILGFNVSGLQHESLLHVTLTGNKLLTGDPFGLEGSLLLTVLLACTVLLLNRYYQRKQHS